VGVLNSSSDCFRAIVLSELIKMVPLRFLTGKRHSEVTTLRRYISWIIITIIITSLLVLLAARLGQHSTSRIRFAVLLFYM